VLKSLSESELEERVEASLMLGRPKTPFFGCILCPLLDPTIFFGMLDLTTFRAKR
jgi:hypothetical protein